MYTLRSEHLSSYRGEAKRCCFDFFFLLPFPPFPTGHVSFPGGHIDEGETPIQAALRETREELGDHLSSDKIDILGEGPPLLAITGTKVYPVLGWLKEDVQAIHFDPNEEEVDEVFIVPISKLIDPSLKKYEAHVRKQLTKEETNKSMSRPVSKQQEEGKGSTSSQQDKNTVMLPVFYGGKHRIWGLTSIITESFLKFVILPTFKRS